MHKVIVSEMEWVWFVRLRLIPMRVACSVGEVGAEVIANVLRLKLVEEVDGYHRLTGDGVRLVERQPPPMPDGGRIVKLQWQRPASDAIGG